ncbi:MAG: hypothetical protein LKI03_08780 [Acetobacter indonesiensis]|nr:hypothetical protein [Acetobacter indonesiensis]MCI1766125.1 hypothetical protein [Acetobacter indonesiensis]
MTVLPLFLFVSHALVMAFTGIGLAFAVLSIALGTHQGQKLHLLLTLTVLPATILALCLPFIATPFHANRLLLSCMQGVLIGPAISLWPLTHLKSAPSVWTQTAQELGANRAARFRLLWLPLLGPSLTVSLILTCVLSAFGTVLLLKASLP